MSTPKTTFLSLALMLWPHVRAGLKSIWEALEDGHISPEEAAEAAYAATDGVGGLSDEAREHIALGLAYAVRDLTKWDDEQGEATAGGAYGPISVLRLTATKRTLLKVPRKVER